MGTGLTVAIALVAEGACLVAVLVSLIELWRRRPDHVHGWNERAAVVAPYLSSIAFSCACAAAVAHIFLGRGALAGVLALLAGAACAAVAAGGLMLVRGRAVRHKVRLTWSYGLLLLLATSAVLVGLYELSGGVS